MRSILSQVIAVVIVDGVFLTMGMTTGYITILIPGLSQVDDGTDIYLDEEELSWIGSIRFIGVPVGCFISVLVTNAFGRKRTAQLATAIFLLCWIGMAFAKYTWQIYFAIGVIGVCLGLTEAPALTYIAEVSQPKLRGMLVASATVSVCIGLVIEFIIGAFAHWRVVAQYSCIVPVVTLFLLSFIPETPHWLVTKSRLEDAHTSLQWLRGWTLASVIEAEFQELHTNIQREEEEATSAFNKANSAIRSYTQMRILHPLALVLFGFFVMHFGGLFTIKTYSVAIFSTLGTPIDSYYATILLGVSHLVGSVACVGLIHVVGKRILTFATTTIAAVGLTAMATYAYSIDATYLNLDNDTETTNSYEWLPLVCALISSCAQMCGICNVPWILITEMFPNENKSSTVSLITGIAYILGFCNIKSFFQMVSTLTLPGTLWCYAAINLVGVILLYFWLPETEGKTLIEISEHYAGKTKLDNKVRRVQPTNNCTNDCNLPASNF